LTTDRSRKLPEPPPFDEPARALETTQRVPPTEGIKEGIKEGKGGEGEGKESPPTPPGNDEADGEREKILLKALESEFLDCSPVAVREWRILCRKAAIRTFDEAAAFVAFAAAQGRRNGNPVSTPALPGAGPSVAGMGAGAVLETS
jgi:hypothetical protein